MTKVVNIFDGEITWYYRKKEIPVSPIIQILTISENER